jgi:hypothetical protein
MYMDRNLTLEQTATLKPLVQEVEFQLKTDSVKQSTLKRILDLVSTYGPTAAVVVDTTSRMLGLKT